MRTAQQLCLLSLSKCGFPGNGYRNFLFFFIFLHSFTLHLLNVFHVLLVLSLPLPFSHLLLLRYHLFIRLSLSFLDFFFFLLILLSVSSSSASFFPTSFYLSRSLSQPFTSFLLCHLLPFLRPLLFNFSFSSSFLLLYCYFSSSSYTSSS